MHKETEVEGMIEAHNGRGSASESVLCQMLPNHQIWGCEMIKKKVLYVLEPHTRDAEVCDRRTRDQIEELLTIKNLLYTRLFYVRRKFSSRSKLN